jgi:hypothetical protein
MKFFSEKAKKYSYVLEANPTKSLSGGCNTVFLGLLCDSFVTFLYEIPSYWKANKMFNKYYFVKPLYI